MKFVKKHLKAIIAVSVVVTLLMVAIILMFTIFSLKDVELKFKTQTNNLSSETIQKEIINKTLDYDGSVLFMNKDRIARQLEKQFPYLKIINIETKIPNKFVIHCAEREELYAIESNNKVFYLDEDLKILRISPEKFVKTESGAVLLSLQNLQVNEENKFEIVALELNLGEAEVGQFLNFGSEDVVFADKIEKITKSLLTAFEQNNRDISMVRAGYTNFEIFYKAQQVSENAIVWHVCLKMIDKGGFETEILDGESKLAEKIEGMLNIISDTSISDPIKLTTHKLTIYENADGQIMYTFVLKK